MTRRALETAVGRRLREAADRLRDRMRRVRAAQDDDYEATRLQLWRAIVNAPGDPMIRPIGRGRR